MLTHHARDHKRQKIRPQQIRSIRCDRWSMLVMLQKI
jgi:hypothetical protein